MGHPFSGYIVYWNKRIYRDLNVMYDRKLAPYGLTSGQVNVLEQLWTLGDGMTQKELHERLGIRPASLTNLLNALVEGGWVVRKSDPQDARSKRIYLTEAGLAQSKVCMEIITELENVVRQGMSPEEISLMLVWMQKNHNNVSNEE
ncbi:MULTISPECIES: MarR family winged helix-turn-helix transcriptional regulator [Paenibacillus]|uniref:MarR family transcriptional regulator n=1 Tax=Paenibacillus agri TaxID=2744309 RepID=A0A850EMH9_9BACL|nr:MarR family transcriptional regulator [Paenibacillus agri]NUU60737.1 MarR family transcriptional regulator [Paenibacillus agri]